MQVKKSQKIFEFFDFFKGVQRIFCAVGGVSFFFFVKFGGREKTWTKMRHGNFRATNPNASQGMSNCTLRGVFLTMRQLCESSKNNKSGQYEGKEKFYKKHENNSQNHEHFQSSSKAFLKSSVAQQHSFLQVF